MKHAVGDACEITKKLYQIGSWIFEEGRQERGKRGREGRREAGKEGGRFRFGINTEGKYLGVELLGYMGNVYLIF